MAAPVAGVGPDLRRAAWLLGALAVVVALRYVAIQAGTADAIVIGFGFGAALAGLAAIARSGARGAPEPGAGGRARDRWWTGVGPARDVARRAAIGLAGGAVLVGLALIGQAAAAAAPLPPPFRADLLGPWAVATIVVATGEEGVLRGAIFDRLIRGAGLWPAILITSLAFALIHVPFYGWRVVPLDLGVGIWLAGLRLASGGILAPSIAHSLADLATWWL
jgi:membrane protease YdiL (CAAX protease family)